MLAEVLSSGTLCELCLGVEGGAAVSLTPGAVIHCSSAILSFPQLPHVLPALQGRAQPLTTPQAPQARLPQQSMSQDAVVIMPD